MRERILKSRLTLVLLGLWSGGFIDVSSHHSSGGISIVAYLVGLGIIGYASWLASWQEDQ